MKMQSLWTLLLVIIAAAPVAAQPRPLYFRGPLVYPPYSMIVSPALTALPQGFVTITAGDETFYYANGVFYQKVVRDGAYVIVPPPIGAVVFRIPEGYQYFVVDGMAYYLYKGVFYKRVLEGYRVIEPPILERPII